MSTATSELETLRARQQALSRIEALLGPLPERLRSAAHQPSTQNHLQLLIEWYDTRMRRQLWDWPQLQREFVHRTPREILSSRAIHYAAPCVDLCTGLAEILKALGYRPRVILSRIARLFQGVKFQMGLEVDADGQTYCLGFTITAWKLIVGRFEVARSRSHVYKVDLPEEDTFDRRYLSLFGIDGVPSVHQVISGYNARRDLAWFKATISERKFSKAQRKARHKAESQEPGTLRCPGIWEISPTAASGST